MRKIIIGSAVAVSAFCFGMGSVSAGTGGTQGPGTCEAAPGAAFIAPAAQEAGPIAGPNGFTWGPTRDGVPPVPGQAVIGVCLLGLD